MNYYILNTNRKEDPSGRDEQTMLNEEIAALYFTGYKERIDDLKTGDVVFFYKNTIGIIAYGEIDGHTYVRNYQGDVRFKDEEHFKRLKNFCHLDNPLSLNDINKTIGTKLNVAHAIFNIQDKYGSAILGEARKRSFAKAA